MSVSDRDSILLACFGGFVFSILCFCIVCCFCKMKKEYKAYHEQIANMQAHQSFLKEHTQLESQS